MASSQESGIYVVGEYLGMTAQKAYVNPKTGETSTKQNVNLLVGMRTLSVEYPDAAAALLAVGTVGEKVRVQLALRVFVVAWDSIVAPGERRRNASIFYKADLKV